MKKDKHFADIYVHLHPSCLTDYRCKVERELCDIGGVYGVHFDSEEQRDSMFVSYDPDTVSSDLLLETIRGSYDRATGVAKLYTTVQGK